MRFALFVDAGYLYAEGSKPLSPSGSKPLRRRSLTLDQTRAIAKLLETAKEKTGGLPLLRIYWYDGVLASGLSDDQGELANTDDVKFRAGVVNSAGQQKGVDSLIVTDLIELSRNRAISDAVLLSGDGDLRVAVQIAQSFGVRVHLVSIQPVNFDDQSRSLLLSQEADTTSEWPRSEVANKLITLKPGYDPVAEELGGSGPSEVPDAVMQALDRAVEEMVSSLDPSDLEDLNNIGPAGQIPKNYDGALLNSGSNQLDGRRRLERHEVTYIRGRFRERVQASAQPEQASDA